MTRAEKRKIQQEKDNERRKDEANKIRESNLDEAGNEVAEKSKILKFAERPIVIIITLIITLAGGIPGLIISWQYFHQKAHFTFILDELIPLPYQQKNMFFLIFAGAVFNDGDKTLFPKNIYLSVKVNDTTYYGKSLLIDSANRRLLLPPTDVKFLDSTAQPDLQFEKEFLPDHPYYGLLFYSFDFKLRQMLKDHYTLRFTIIDIYNKEFNYEITSANLSTTKNEGGYTNPKVGLIFNDSTETK